MTRKDGESKEWLGKTTKNEIRDWKSLLFLCGLRSDTFPREECGDQHEKCSTENRKSRAQRVHRFEWNDLPGMRDAKVRVAISASA
jgi:hypothetical protein